MSVLRDLQREFPLGPRWADPAVVEASVEVSGIEIKLAGISLEFAPGQLVTGSAGQLDGSPLPRAYFEFLERTAVVEAMEVPELELNLRTAEGMASETFASRELFPSSPAGASWVYARSNGVATGRTWAEACGAAELELAERDRLLRSWYGQIAPIRLPLPDSDLDSRLQGLYELESYAFEDRNGGATPAVVGVFGFPRRPDVPRVCGFGAHGELPEARALAWRECVQQLGFLWDEPVPDALPRLTLSAQYHLDVYLHPSNHRPLREWLAGGHLRRPCVLRDPSQGLHGQRLFADLTPERLRGRAWVVKALPTAELPLTFGHGHPALVGPVPPDLQVHPIA